MKVKALVVLLISLTFGFSGCGGDDEQSGVDDRSTTFPMTLETPEGPVSIPSKPTKIVSLAPTTTEILYGVGAGPQVKAVDELSNFPADAPKSGLSGYSPNLEAIVAQGPDLVLVTNDTNDLVDNLEQRKIPVLVLPAASDIEEMYTQIENVGRATGNLSTARELVERTKSRVAEIVADVPKRDSPLTYYYELDTSYYSVTSDTFIGSVLAMAGMTNIADAVASGNAYPQLTAEAIVRADPRVILLADAKCCSQSLDTVSQRPGWSNISAVRTGRVIGLDDDVASRWTPRIVDLLKAVVDATKGL